MTDPLLTEREAAEELHVSAADIKYACQHRLITHIRIRQFFRLPMSEVEAMRGRSLDAKIAAHRLVPEVIAMHDSRDRRVVYFLDAGAAIKIGVATDPHDRLAAVQTGNHVKLRLIGYIPGGLALENAIHKGLAEYRIQGEWFKATGRVRAFVNNALKLANA